MTLAIRRATSADADYIAHAMVSIPRHIMRPDAYAAGLPKQVTTEVVQHAIAGIAGKNSIALIAEVDGTVRGCLLGDLRETSLPPAGLGEVGYIDVAWVEPDSRGEGVAKALVARAERWFASRGIDTVELAYLAANGLAEQAWSGLGYTPFRVFAYRSLGGDVATLNESSGNAPDEPHPR